MRIEQEVNIFAKEAMIKRFQAVETSISITQGNIAALISESEIAELQSGGTTMYSKLGKIDMNVSGLAQQYSELVTKYDSTAQQYTALENKLAEYKTSVDGLAADISQVSTKLDGNYSTTSEVNTAIKAATDEISLSISKVYVTSEVLSSAKTDLEKQAKEYASSAESSAKANTNDVLKSYSTTTEMNAAIKAATDEISLSVSKTYVTNEKLTSTQKDLEERAQNYASAAQTAADANTANVLQNYSTTLQMNSAISAKSDEILLTVSRTYTTGESVSSLIEQKADSIRLKSSQLSWESEKSSMTSDGKLTCSEADITGTINAGGKDNKNGEIKIYDEENNVKAILDKDGIRHYESSDNIVPYHYRSEHCTLKLLGNDFSGGGQKVCTATVEFLLSELSLSNEFLIYFQKYGAGAINVTANFQQIISPGDPSQNGIYTLGTFGIKNVRLYFDDTRTACMEVSAECSYINYGFNNMSPRYIKPKNVYLNIDITY